MTRLLDQCSSVGEGRDASVPASEGSRMTPACSRILRVESKLRKMCRLVDARYLRLTIVARGFWRLHERIKDEGEYTIATCLMASRGDERIPRPDVQTLGWRGKKQADGIVRHGDEAFRRYELNDMIDDDMYRLIRSEVKLSMVSANSGRGRELVVSELNLDWHLGDRFDRWLKGTEMD